ncbi:LppU/SCO3897 family protein [Streptomyces sp. NPDC054796]
MKRPWERAGKSAGAREERAGWEDGEGASDVPGAVDIGDGDGSRDRARRGRWWLVIAAALFATVILPKMVGPESHSAPSPAASAPGPSPFTGAPSTLPQAPVSPSTGTGTVAGTGTGDPSGAPDPYPGTPADGGASAGSEPATAAAFRAVKAGQCLSVHRVGREWSAAAPSAALTVDCSAERAYVRVSDVRSRTADCPDGDGRAHWSHTSDGRTTALCLTRQFHKGDCLLALSDEADDAGTDSAGSGSGPGADAGSVRADLMSAPDCATGQPPSPYDRLLTVTGIHRDAPEPVPQGLCARRVSDDRQYWTWEVGGGTVVCAAER